MLRLFQGGCLVDWEVVLVERSKVGKCDLVVGTVPSMLLMRVIGLSRNPILAMFLETSRAIEGEPSGNSARRQGTKSERIKTDITKTSEEKRGMRMAVITMIVLENTANQSIDITTITSIPVLAVCLVSKEGIENTENMVSIKNTENIVSIKNTENMVSIENTENMVSIKNTENMVSIKNTEMKGDIENTEMKEGIEATKTTTVEKGNKIVIVIVMLLELFVNKNAQTGDIHNPLSSFLSLSLLFTTIDIVILIITGCNTVITDINTDTSIDTQHNTLKTNLRTIQPLNISNKSRMMILLIERNPIEPSSLLFSLTYF